MRNTGQVSIAVSGAGGWGTSCATFQTSKQVSPQHPWAPTPKKIRVSAAAAPPKWDGQPQVGKDYCGNVIGIVHLFGAVGQRRHALRVEGHLFGAVSRCPLQMGFRQADLPWLPRQRDWPTAPLPCSGPMQWAKCQLLLPPPNGMDSRKSEKTTAATLLASSTCSVLWPNADMLSA